MPQEQKLSKKDLKQLKKLQELEQANLARKQSMVKWISIGVASILFLSLFSFLFISAKKSSQTPNSQVLSFSPSGWVRGSASASATLTEFSDLQCPACRAADPSVEKALQEFNGRVKLVYKHFPLPSHKYGLLAARAAEAAGKQDKFWQMHDLLFEKQTEWGSLLEPNSTDPTPKFEGYAASLGLDVAKFKVDMNDKSLEAKIKAEQEEGVKAGVNATPTFYVNGKIIQYDGTYNSLKKTIEQSL